MGTVPTLCHPPLRRGWNEGLKLLLAISMSGRPDPLILMCAGSVGVEEGGCPCNGRVGDRTCQSEGLTDRQAMGTGDRSHPGPSSTNMGAFIGESNC